MRDVGIGEQPHLHLGLVEGFQNRPRLGVGPQEFVQGEGIVNLTVEVQRINLVVSRQSFDREAIIFVVLLVKAGGFLGRHVQVLYEVFVDQQRHVIMDILAFRIETVVDVEEEDCSAVV